MESSIEKDGLAMLRLFAVLIRIPGINYWYPAETGVSICASGCDNAELISAPMEFFWLYFGGAFEVR